MDLRFAIFDLRLLNLSPALSQSTARGGKTAIHVRGLAQVGIMPTVAASKPRHVISRGGQYNEKLCAPSYSALLVWPRCSRSPARAIGVRRPRNRRMRQSPL